MNRIRFIVLAISFFLLPICSWHFASREEASALPHTITSDKPHREESHEPASVTYSGLPKPRPAVNPKEIPAANTLALPHEDEGEEIEFEGEPEEMWSYNGVGPALRSEEDGDR